MVILLAEGPSCLWTESFMSLYGENLRRQGLSFISLANTAPYGWAVVKPKNHAHGMFFVTFLAENINIITRHVITLTTELPECKEVTGSVFHSGGRGKAEEPALPLRDESIGISAFLTPARKQKKLRCFCRYDMSTAKWKV
jgi:hypothetical protein